MNDKQEKRYLYINGQAVPVSEQVYQAYHHYERKEEYFTYDLKAEQFTCDQEAQTVTFTPSREDSYERLLAAKTQFPSVGPSVEEQTIARLDMKALMRDLTEEERGIIWELYYLDKSEREASAALHLAKTTFRRRKKALLEKLRNLLNENL